jgi:hypothetical protein
LVEVEFDEDALVGILPVYLELPEKTLCKETNRIPPSLSARTLRARENLLKPEKLIVDPKIDGSRPSKKVAKKGCAGKGCAGKPSPKVSTPVVPPLSLKHTTESLNKYTVAQLRETLIMEGIGGVGASRWSKQCCIDAILETYVAPTLPFTLEMSQKSKKESKKEPKEKPKKKPKKEPKKEPKKKPKKESKKTMHKMSKAVIKSESSSEEEDSSSEEEEEEDSSSEEEEEDSSSEEEEEDSSSEEELPVEKTKKKKKRERIKGKKLKKDNIAVLASYLLAENLALKRQSIDDEDTKFRAKQQKKKRRRLDAQAKLLKVYMK